MVCEGELEILQTRFYTELHDKGLEIFAINYVDPLETIWEWKHEHYDQEIEYFMLYDEGAEVWLQYMFGAMAVPTIYIVDQNGTVAYREVGFTEEAIYDTIVDLLGNPVGGETWGGIKADYIK